LAKLSQLPILSVPPSCHSRRAFPFFSKTFDNRASNPKESSDEKDPKKDENYSTRFTFLQKQSRVTVFCHTRARRLVMAAVLLFIIAFRVHTLITQNKKKVARAQRQKKPTRKRVVRRLLEFSLALINSPELSGRIIFYERGVRVNFAASPVRTPGLDLSPWVGLGICELATHSRINFTAAALLAGRESRLPAVIWQVSICAAAAAAAAGNNCTRISELAKIIAHLLTIAPGNAKKAASRVGLFAILSSM
jgi:hypothetical protein